jgi:hypothetical protein
MLHCVITTIQHPTDCMYKLSDRLQTAGGILIVAGDTKGPEDYNLKNTIFLSIEAQEKSGFSLADMLPTKHYARKNMGYLKAIQNGATCIYETDDDNRPNESWHPRSETVTNCLSLSRPNGWLNVYKYYTDEKIWPRGLPLEEIIEDNEVHERTLKGVRCPVQQGLVNNSPDVDAIWRLVMDRPFDFDPTHKHTVYLEPNTWCPFNTQSTWWWPVAYPLLYIPSYCSFRMCDIWKSFVAQRCLWTLDIGIAFHAPEVIQERNAHDLNRDFEDEIPGYTKNRNIKNILTNCSLKSGEANVADNLMTCYQALVEANIFPIKELELVSRWCEDVRVAQSL